MRSSRQLFLLGGSSALETVADPFILAAGGNDAVVALLMQSGKGWEKYLSGYIEPWIKRGISHIWTVVPGKDGDLGPDAEVHIASASGIFIEGGHTPTYHRLYAQGHTRSLIQQRHLSGVPVAGVSAGALIAPEICVLTSVENGEEVMRIEPGLNLVQDLVVGVHYSASIALPAILRAMEVTGISRGLGIDDAACAVFRDGYFAEALGQSVYWIVPGPEEPMVSHVS